MSERATDERVGAPVMRRRPDHRGRTTPSARMSRSGFFSSQIDELVARVQRRRLGDNCPARARSGQWTSRPRRPPRRTEPRPASRRAPAPRSPSSSDTGSATPPVPLPQGLRRRDVFVVGRLLRRRGRAAPRRFSRAPRRALPPRGVRSEPLALDRPRLLRVRDGRPFRGFCGEQRRPRHRDAVRGPGVALARPRARARARAFDAPPPRRHGPGRGGARRSCA